MHPPRKKFKTVDAYIKSFPRDTQTVLRKLRQTIHAAVPGLEEAISYGIPTFRLNGKYLVYIAAYEHHIGMYPIPKGNASMEKQISKYQSGKGTLRFPLDKPTPDALVKNIVLARKKQRQLEIKIHG